MKLIETIFPESIDKLNEEVSERLGAKPCLIEPCNDELLCEFFFGKSLQEMKQLAQYEDVEIIQESKDGTAEAAQA